VLLGSVAAAVAHHSQRAARSSTHRDRLVEIELIAAA
jgi:hypothetical protein